MFDDIAEPPLGWTYDLPRSGELAHGDREALLAGPNGRVWWSPARGFEVEADWGGEG